MDDEVTFEYLIAPVPTLVRKDGKGFTSQTTRVRFRLNPEARAWAQACLGTGKKIPRPDSSEIERIAYWPLDHETAILEIEHRALDDECRQLSYLHRSAVGAEVFVSREFQEQPEFVNSSDFDRTEPPTWLDLSGC
ncbi:MAG TPA: hypothetical protein VMD91_03345 [Candidatus Sulfotelmatobacter sp.]|nr:hypothetical protein [Candidatus Sulfotelmatobacter sp.]